MKSKKALHIFTLTVITLLTVSSCSLDQNYSLQHHVNVPHKWNAIDPQLHLQSQALACIPWWHQLNDPTLNRLVARGLHCNNNLREAMAHVEAAEGELRKVELDWLPSMGSALGYSSFPYLGFPGVLATILPTYTINIFRQIKAQQKANFELKSTQAMRDGVKLVVIAQIVGSYLRYLSYKRSLVLLQHIDRDWEEFVKIYQATYQTGLFSKITLTEARSELNLIHSKIRVVQQNIVVSQNAIRYLLDENPKEFAFKRRFNQLDPEQMIVAALPLTVIEHRPDLIQVTNELNATRAGIGIALSNFLPTIQLSAARGDIATVPNGTTLGMPVYFNQALLQTPIFTFSSLGELKKSRGLNKAAYYRYLNTLRAILRDINNDISAHDNYHKRYYDIHMARKNIQQKYQFNVSLYRQGIISYTQLLEEKIRLEELNTKENQSKLDQMLAIVNLYQDLAVGYGCMQ